jgi:hypothetical protein
MTFRNFSLFSLVSTAFLASLLTGCTLHTVDADTPVAGPSLNGRVFGGNQPVAGEHIYLMAATVSGVGAAGYGLASTSLLNPTLTGHSDSIGAYVLTNSSGIFALNSEGPTYFYTCPSASTQVYLYGLGGNTGAGSDNSAAGFLYALGSCGNLNSSTYAYVNELTTVAAAYSLAGFATDALHISIPKYANATQQTNNLPDALAQTDLQNAFAGVNNLVDVGSGTALSTTPGSNGTPTTAQLNTLGNILASCVNTRGPSSSSCSKLLGNAGSTGGATGTIPTDTATAAINLAHYPYVSSAVMGNLYALQAASGAPFPADDTSQPLDFTLSITYDGGGVNHPVYVAIDASGNAWIANSGADSISELSSAGVALSPSTGYTGGGLNISGCIAIDASGNAWVANDGNNNGSSISEFSSTGVAISPSTGYTGGGDDDSYSIAVDPSGNVWVTNLNSSISEFASGGLPLSPGPGYHNGVYNSGYVGGGLNSSFSLAMDPSGNAWVAGDGNSNISEISNVGVAVSPSTGYTGGGLNNPFSIALDASGDVWTANESGDSISKFSSSGSPISSTGYTGGGLSYPESIAIDGSGNAWTANFNGNSISKFSNSGSPITSSRGYTASLNEPYSIAIDGSGNAWVANNKGNSVTEFIGVATPVATPLVANLIAPYSTPASKP